MDKRTIQRQLNEVWKEVKEIDNKVNGNKMTHQEAIVRLSTEVRNLVVVINELTNEL